MTNYHFDEVINRNRMQSLKWDKYEDQDILPMWVADTDFKAPPAVLEALQQRIDHGVLGYGVISESVTEAIQVYLKSQFNWHISADWIVFLPGLVCGLNLACLSVAHPGRGVYIPTPVYPPFRSAPVNACQTPYALDMVMQGERWVLDFDRFEAQLEARSDELKQTPQLFLFCNPHNPGGTVYHSAELARLAELAKRHNLIICSDEIHCDLVLSQQAHHIPLASLNSDIADRTITLMAPSKTFNIAGLGCSMAIIPNSTLRQKFTRARQGIVPDVNVLSVIATEAAYRNGMDWLSEQLVYLRENRDLCLARINKMPGLSLPFFDATYLAWIDARGTGLKDPAIFFEQHGVGLSPGKPFGQEQYVRLNFGCTRAQLRQALDRMEAALQTLQK